MLATLTLTICVVIKEVMLLVDDEWGIKQAKMENRGKRLIELPWEYVASHNDINC